MQYLENRVSVIVISMVRRPDESLSSHWEALLFILNLIGQVVDFCHRQQAKDLAGNEVVIVHMLAVQCCTILWLKEGRLFTQE